MSSRFITLACETRVGSPLDFQLKRVSALKCLRALRFKRSGKSMRSPLLVLVKKSPKLCMLIR
ncbi:hypothetical protein CJ215_05255 [Gardnerella swidsinskii]|nr:hypothetical protein CJ215_05255 [Gardnerella vaginalis]